MDSPTKQKKSRFLNLPLGQPVLLLLIFNIVAAIATLVANHVVFLKTIVQPNEAITAKCSRKITGSLKTSSSEHQNDPNYRAIKAVYNHNVPAPPIMMKQFNHRGPKVAWLMSFPNSGTSFTVHMTREACNCTIATNYALEGEVKDQPSVQAIPGEEGENGPFLLITPLRVTAIPETILTKTHCRAFCSGPTCREEETIQTVRSFMTGCLSGYKAVQTEESGLEVVPVTYDPSLVSKAIHIFRHPLDNIVARFHLLYNSEATRMGNLTFREAFPNNATGFQSWCRQDDLNLSIITSRFVDRRLRRAMRAIPCMNEFFRYVQWHNSAFSVTREMALPTMILHYHEYEYDYRSTRDRVLSWLGLEQKGEGVAFHAGKTYRHFYSKEQKRAIHWFLREFSSSDTWEQLKDYVF